MENVVTFAHNIIAEYISKESYVIDATIGNGHDLLFLAKAAKHVYGFDIQKQALMQSKSLCMKNNIANISLFLQSHENMAEFVEHKVDAVMFNLGYLPNGDKSITTKPKTTINAIDNILPLLNKKGVITITIYIGHEEGKKEETELEDFFRSLNPSLYNVIRYQHINRPTAPYTVCIQKR